MGVSLAFGLTVLVMVYAVGHISGAHFNPAVSIGAWASGRFPVKKLLPYIVVQVAGAIAAGGVLYSIASGKAGFSASRLHNNCNRHPAHRKDFHSASFPSRGIKLVYPVCVAIDVELPPASFVVQAPDFSEDVPFPYWPAAGCPSAPPERSSACSV